MDPDSLEPRVGSSYPKEHQKQVTGRTKRTLGDPLGLTHFGVNLVELAPGAWSSQRHWHSAEDEFVFVVSGQITLVTDGGRQVLDAGMVAGFPAGKADGHHLINEGNETAAYLEVGDRSDDDTVVYPDIDMQLTSPAQGREFQHRDGRPHRD
jgi:uncharacterized cupin superfamily protein